MIEAGSIGIKAIFIDAEARQSADRFYADLKRKRDEAMSGVGAGAPGAGGQVNPGAWRNGGQWGGNSVWVNPGGWRGGGGGGGGFPNWMQGGGGGGGGQGAGGGIPPWLLGWQSPINQQQQFPSWMMGMQSQLPQPQQIPPWLYGWSSPVNPNRGGGGGGGPRSAFGFIRPVAAAYMAARFTGDALREYYNIGDREYAGRTHGASAGLTADKAENDALLASPFHRVALGVMSDFSEGLNMIRGKRGRFITSAEDRREAIDRAESSIKDVAAGRERLSAQREATSESARFNQRAEIFSIHDAIERRTAAAKNSYDTLQMSLDNRLATMRDELAANDDPLATRRLKAGIESTGRNNAKVLQAARRARAFEEADIRRDEAIGSRAGQRDVSAAKFEYEDRPMQASAQRLFGRTMAAFEKSSQKSEEDFDILRQGRYELLNMQKEITRRGTAESFDPHGAAFGVKQSGKEDAGEINRTIKELIKTIQTWMPGLK